MKTILTKRWNYSLQENAKGELILSVLCGTAGLFERVIILSETEKNNINNLGEPFLDELANDIRNNPDKYKEMAID
jgi:hypothetical protein